MNAPSPTPFDLLRLAIGEIENAAQNYRRMARTCKSAAQDLEQRVVALSRFLPVEERPPDDRPQ